MPRAERDAVIAAALLDEAAHAHLVSLLQHHDLAGHGTPLLAEPAA